MARTAAEVESEIARLKSEGKHAASREMRELRAELKALADGDTATMAPFVNASSPPPPGLLASSDVGFINDALVQLVLHGKVGKVERGYSDLRSALYVKHIFEDAAGLTPSVRLTIPTWESLNRDRDSGEKFKPGENQTIVDGLAQRGAPVRMPSKPVMTAPDGGAIPYRPSRTLNEPEGTAEFLDPDEAERVATS